MTCFNPLNATSATIQFHRFKDIEFATQSFILPSIAAIYPTVQTPHMAMPMGQGAVRYEKLTLNFIIDSELTNYKSIAKWLQQAPTTKNKELFSDATVTLLSNKKNPIAHITFVDVMPTFISQINFEYAIVEPNPIIATAEFDYTYYQFE